MGRYLNALKTSGNGGGTTLINLKNPFEVGCLGSLGTPPPCFEINQAANDNQKHGDNVPRFGWLIHFTDRDPLTVTFSPEVNHAEALACYPDAVAAEPMPEPLNDPTPDDRITCRQCGSLNYSGVCSIAAPGGAVSANRGYRPDRDLLQRCEAFNERKI
jgi:hypothetical protein